MAIKIDMPRLSDTMESGTLIKWRVKVGDKITSGDVLADVETDKATMELPAFDDGTVARLVASEGDSLPIGSTIAIIAEEGESVEEAAGTEVSAAKGDTAAQGKPGPEKTPPATEPREEERQASAQAQEEKVEEEVPAESTAAAQAGGGMRISPLAAKLAQQHGVDLDTVKGSGPDGRIIKRDILAAAEQAKGKPAAAKSAAAPVPAPAPMPKLEGKSISLSNMRKTIARRLVESKSTIPHFTVTLSVNMDPLMQLRATLNEQLEPQGVKLSVNDFIVRAVALALLQHPVVNSSFAGDTIQQHGSVNVGVAVALPAEKGGGLVVPVIRDTHSKGLRAISAETRALAKKARDTGLTPQEMADGTFTVSNLGMLGVDHFEAIINPPQAAILAVGAAIEKAVVRNGQIVVGHEMTCTLSADHRVVDGAQAAEYLQTLRQMLENPAVLLV